MGYRLPDLAWLSIADLNAICAREDTSTEAGQTDSAFTL